MPFDEHGYICHFNDACRCQVADCDTCGWNPEVSARRLKEIIEKMDDYPCRSCTKVDDPDACLKKGCSPWRKWFVKHWDQQKGV